VLHVQRSNLADPDNYALAATGRLQLSSSTSLKLTAQVDSLAHLQPLMPQGGRIWQQQQQQRGWAKMGQNSSLSMQLKQQLEGLDVTADLALNEPSVEGVRRYATTPLRLAVDLAPSSSSRHSSSSSSRLKGLLFRVGLHGVVAPVEGAAAGDSQQQQQQQHALSVHCQGAVALSGSKTVWEASQKPWQSAAAAAKEQRAKRQKQRQRQLEAAQQAVQEQDQQQQQQAQLQVQPLQLGDSSSAAADISPEGSVAAAAAMAEGAGDAATPAAGSSPGSEQHSSSSSKHRHHNHHHKTSTSSSSSSRLATAKPSSTSSTTTAAASSSNRTSTSHTGPGPRKRYLTLQGQEIPLPLLSPANVQDSIQETGSRLERLRSELRQLRGRVEAGDLQQLGESGKKGGGGLGGLGKDAASCWSSFLAGPHFKVSAVTRISNMLVLYSRWREGGGLGMLAAAGRASWQDHTSR
jgi:hypothetical protein